MKKSSEFGKGLAYNLGLFAAHQCTWGEERKAFSPATWPELWFNGASDHCYELQYQAAPRRLRKRILDFKNKCLHWGHGFKEPKATKEDVDWAISEAKNLLLELDKANKIPCLKADWD